MTATVSIIRSACHVMTTSQKHVMLVTCHVSQLSRNLREGHVCISALRKLIQHPLSLFIFMICKVLSIARFWIRWFYFGCDHAPCVLVADRLACNKICIKLYDKKFPWPSCSDMSPWMFQILRRHLDNNSWLNVVGNHNFYCPSMVLTFATLSWHLDWEVLVLVFRSPKGN